MFFYLRLQSPLIPPPMVWFGFPSNTFNRNTRDDPSSPGDRSASKYMYTP